jgi:VanZ family protein
MNFMNKKYYKLAFFTAVLGILILAVIPEGGGVDTGWDKANHFIAFFTLSLLLNRASSTTHARIRNALSLVAFGMFIEVVQAFISYRSADYHDVIADSVGIMVFQILLSLHRGYRRRLLA